MKEIINVAVLVGSLREQSYNLKLAHVLQSIAPAHMKLHHIDIIGDLPFYNEDLETANPPENWVAFRKRIRECHAVLFVTPEYNRSCPAVLKNAIDVGSRPYGQSVWTQKPAAILSSSIGAIGGFGSNHHLRQSLVFLDMPCMQQPEAYLGNIGSSFDDKGIISDNTRAFLTTFMDAYVNWLSHFIR